MKEKETEGEPSLERSISPELCKILNEEVFEARISAAIDAAAEDGFRLTREEAMEILKQTTDLIKDD